MVYLRTNLCLSSGFEWFAAMTILYESSAASFMSHFSHKGDLFLLHHSADMPTILPVLPLGWMSSSCVWTWSCGREGVGNFRVWIVNWNGRGPFIQLGWDISLVKVFCGHLVSCKSCLIYTLWVRTKVGLVLQASLDLQLHFGLVGAQRWTDFYSYLARKAHRTTNNVFLQK